MKECKRKMRERERILGMNNECCVSDSKVASLGIRELSNAESIVECLFRCIKRIMIKHNDGCSLANVSLYIHIVRGFQVDDAASRVVEVTERITLSSTSRSILPFILRARTRRTRTGESEKLFSSIRENHSLLARSRLREISCSIARSVGIFPFRKPVSSRRLTSSTMKRQIPMFQRVIQVS